jgi:hypothetical protein
MLGLPGRQVLAGCGGAAVIAYVAVGDGAWSIASVDPDEPASFQWWCGTQDEWVSPHSSHWNLSSETYNAVFPSLQAARRFAKSQGWEPGQ